MKRFISTNKQTKYEFFQVKLLVINNIRIAVEVFNNRAKLNKIN